MKTERILAAFVVLLVVGGLAAWASGLLRVGEAAGKLIEVAAHLEPPDLDDPALIRRGAAHYDLICAGCHASPLAPNRAEHLALSPPAPTLHLRLDDWLPEVLFLTVKHGIPDSGMPAWPAEGRDDEIWAMVAFLQVLPDLDTPEYARLAGLDGAPQGPAVTHLCQRCHGPDGRGEANGAFPRLDIQTADYLAQALQAYRADTRQSGFMRGIALRLDDRQIAQAAAYFAAGPMSAAEATAPPDMPAACTACHGPPAVARPEFPSLAGQYPAYLEAQLALFAAEPFLRGGGPFVDLMRKVGHKLEDSDITAISRWFAGQVPQGE